MHQTEDVTEELLKKRTGVISEILKTCEARITYNKQLWNHYKNVDLNEFLTFAKNAAFNNLALIDESNLKEYKGFLGAGISHELIFYNSILKLISSSPPDQAFVDKLHSEFHMEYELRRESENLAQHKMEKASQKTISSQYLELGFIRGSLFNLSLIRSEAEMSFTQKCKFVFYPRAQGKMLIGIDYTFIKQFLGKCHDLIEKINSLVKKAESNAQKLTTPFIVNESQRNFLEEIDRYNISINTISQNFDDEDFTQKLGLHGAREIYFTIFDIFQSLKENSQEIQTFNAHILSLLKEDEDQRRSAHVVASTRKKQGKKTRGKPSEALIETITNEEKNPIPTEPSQVLAINSKGEQERQALLLTNMDKILNYKIEVATSRAEKENRKKEQKLKERALLEKQKLTQIEGERNKEENNLRNAFQLLCKLNNNNFFLVELIFKTPTPHNTIGYKEIKSLFGTQAEGKLPGSISSVSGSHRKVCIQDTFGFFDKFEIDTEEKDGVSKFTGGLFQAHKKGHTTKLPSIAIEMVRSTLEKAGITKVNLELFSSTKEKLMLSGNSKPEFEQLWAMVNKKEDSPKMMVEFTKF